MSFVDIFARTEIYSDGPNRVFHNLENLYWDDEAFSKIVEWVCDIVGKENPDVIIAHQERNTVPVAVAAVLSERGAPIKLVYAHERRAAFPGSKYTSNNLDISNRPLDKIKEDLGRQFRGFYIDDVVVSGSDVTNVGTILPQAGGRLVGTCSLIEYPGARIKLGRRLDLGNFTSIVTFDPKTRLYGPGKSSNPASGGGRFDQEPITERAHHYRSRSSTKRPGTIHRINKGDRTWEP